jgi:hypothetical protein
MLSSLFLAEEQAGFTFAYLVAVAAVGRQGVAAAAAAAAKTFERTW